MNGIEKIGLLFVIAGFVNLARTDIQNKKTDAVIWWLMSTIGGVALVLGDLIPL